MANTYYKGSIVSVVKVGVTDAFVQNAAVEVEVLQPAGSILRNAYIRCTAAPTVTAAQDLGFKLGSTSGGIEIKEVTDGIIDAAASTTPLAVDGLIDLKLATLTSAGSNTSVAASAGFTTADRTIYLNTTATNSAIAVAGAVEWIMIFDMIGA